MGDVDSAMAHGQSWGCEAVGCRVPPRLMSTAEEKKKLNQGQIHYLCKSLLPIYILIFLMQFWLFSLF